MHFAEIHFEWDERNERHLWERHQVAADEAEEVFCNPNVVRSAARMGHPHSTEARYHIFGRSDAERPLFLIFIFRGRIGPVTSVRVFSGRTMDKDEVAWFEDHI